MGVNVRVDGLMVLTGAAVAGATLLYLNRGKLNAINPVSSENVVNKSFEAAVGEENTVAFFDRLFAARELVMDWTYPGDYEASPYAKQVWGIE